MDIHEYQAKERFRSVGIPVPPGRVVSTPEEAEVAAKEYGGTAVSYTHLTLPTILLV